MCNLRYQTLELNYTHLIQSNSTLISCNLLHLSSSLIVLPFLPNGFLQSSHLQLMEHPAPPWKQSQYFFRHPDFLQVHFLLIRSIGHLISCSTDSCPASNVWTGLKGKTGAVLGAPCIGLLRQGLHPHDSVQCDPEAKHTQ